MKKKKISIFVKILIIGKNSIQADIKINKFSYIFNEY